MNELLKALYDSFIAGFQLAWQLANELNIREKQHPIMTGKSVRSDAVAISEDTEGGTT